MLANTRVTRHNNHTEHLKFTLKTETLNSHFYEPACFPKYTHSQHTKVWKTAFFFFNFAEQFGHAGKLSLNHISIFHRMAFTRASCYRKPIKLSLQSFV